MDEKRPSFNREVFIVRLWAETAGDPAYLGEIQHVGSGRVLFVRSLGDLPRLFQQQMEDARQEPFPPEPGLR